LHFIWIRSTEGINNAGRLDPRTDTTMANNSETIWHNVQSAAKGDTLFLLNPGLILTIHPDLIQVSTTN